MSKNDPDDLYNALYGPSDKSADAKVPQKPAAPVKPPAPAAAKPTDDAAAQENLALIQEAMGRDAAQVFSQTFAARRDARQVGQVTATSVHVPEKSKLAFAAKADAPPTFASSLAPWTLFKGFAVIMMLTYIIGFHGRLLAESWGALLAISFAVAALVLTVDFMRFAATNGSETEKPTVKPHK